MSADREIVDAEKADIHRHFAESLHGIADRQPACFAYQRGGFRDRLEDACLIVREHQAQHRHAFGSMIP